MKKNLKRLPSSHKGDYGHLLVIAGSRAMPGAAWLACESALRSGIGKLTLAALPDVAIASVRKSRELIWLPLIGNKAGAIDFKNSELLIKEIKNVDALLMGPGLGTHPSTQKLVKILLSRVTIPTVLDADGLNALAGNPQILTRIKAPVLVTPHAGEFRRLTGIKINATDASSRRKVAKKFSTKYDCTLVLKGHRTVVTSPNGRVYENSTGNAGMASAGMGDVLSGILGALVAQGFDPYFAGCLGAYVHGKAGDQAARRTSKTSLLARDLMGEIPRVFARLETMSRLDSVLLE